MPTIAIQSYQSPVGELLLGVFNEQLCICDWSYRKMRKQIDHRIQKNLQATYQMQDHHLLRQTQAELTAYFEGKRQEFTIPLLLVGTLFQQTVWQHLQKVQYGNTETYLGLAKKMGNELAIRAVASANGANAISILIPCHRIVGSSGELTGYAGGLPAKKKLLELEGVQQQLQLF